MKSLGKWWAGVRCLCRECGEHFELEAGDLPRHGEKYFTEVDCPACGAPVVVPMPWGAEIPRR